VDAVGNFPQDSAHMDGSLAHRHVRMNWTFDGGNHQWVFAVSFGDVGISRLYPGVLSRAEAENEAARIAPELFRMAEAWLK